MKYMYVWMIVCFVLRVNRVHVYCHAYNYMVPHSPLCYWKWTCLGSITTTMSIHIKLEASDIPQGLNIILWEINLGVSLWGSVSINILTWSLSSCFFKMISTDLFTVLSPKCSLKRTRLLVTSSLIVNLISMGPSRSLAERIPRLPSKQETN